MDFPQYLIPKTEHLFPGSLPLSLERQDSCDLFLGGVEGGRIFKLLGRVLTPQVEQLEPLVTELVGQLLVVHIPQVVEVLSLLDFGHPTPRFPPRRSKRRSLPIPPRE